MSDYIGIEDAITLLMTHTRPISRIEKVPLRRALGRIVAEPLQALYDEPPFPRAAMDGYAFRAQDTPGTLRVVGTVFAGKPWERPWHPGDALRIMTGAPVPPGFDTVLEQEAVSAGETIAVLKPVSSYRNIMRQGHQYHFGDTVMVPGTHLTPLRIGQCASLGLADVAVFAPAQVTVLVTGDELQTPGRPLKPGYIYDTNGPLLQALLNSRGMEVTRRHVKDDPKKLWQALESARASQTSLVITTGGASVGQKDYLPAILERHYRRLFWRIDMHPGKAMAAGLLKDDLPIIALSGNPGAMLTAWYLILLPLLSHLTHSTFHIKEVSGRLARPYPKPTRETRYLKARFQGQGGNLLFDVIENQSADALESFVQADGLVVVPHQSPPVDTDVILRGLWLPKD